MTVIQVNNILNSKEVNILLVGALSTSAMFVAEAVSYMTYMMDISEDNRQKGNLFYGFVSLHGLRLVVVKWSMYLLSFCQLLGKSLMVNIIYQIGGKTLVVAVMGGEMVAYLIFKVVRGDFRYWVPVPQGTSLAGSLITRVVVKVTCDFTGFLHARHPYEMGGFYWLLNMVLTQTSVFGAIKLKEDYGWGDEVAERGKRFVKDDQYFQIASAELALWLVAMMGLLLASEKDYRFTFYSLRTAKQYSRAKFDSGVDSMMIEIFEDHPSYYDDFKELVVVWLGDNWNRWHQEHPKWFTDDVIKVSEHVMEWKGVEGSGREWKR